MVNESSLLLPESLADTSENHGGEFDKMQGYPLKRDVARLGLRLSALKT
jgi:hypothetical protein